MSSRVERLNRSVLYLVCDEPEEAFLDAALRGGVDIVQLRMKTDDAERIRAAAARVLAACRRHGALAILNDRPDLAAEFDLDGVHVGQSDAPPAEARAIVGPDRIVGLSTHTPAQIADADSVDYIGVGPVHETPTKPGRPAVGLELVAHAAGQAAVPFFAIGGIDPGNVGKVIAAGARRVAVVRALTEAGDPEAAARTLRAELDAAEAAETEGARVGAAQP